MTTPLRTALLYILLASSAALPAQAQNATLLRADSLRAEPFSDARAVAPLPQGGKLRVLERKGTWAHAEYQGLRGWLRALNLRADDVAAIKPEGVLALQTGRAAEGGVSVPLAIRSARPPRHALRLLDDMLDQRDPTRAVKFSARTLGAGDVELALESSSTGYLYVFAVDARGAVLRCMFPNTVSPDNELPARQPMLLPGAGWRIDTDAGEVRLIAVVATMPLDLVFEGKQADGAFFTVDVVEENRAHLAETLAKKGTYGASMIVVGSRK